MSRIIVDAVRNSSASSDGITLASDGSVTIPGNATCSGTATGFCIGGKVLQTIMVEKTDTTSHNSTTTILDISGMTVNITPSATTSKILVTSCLQVVTVQGQYSFALYLMRDSTYLSRGDASGSHRTRATFGGLSGGNEYDLRPFTISYLDSPNTTSQVTYKWRWNNPSHNQVIYLNRPYGFADGGYTVMTSSNIIVQEIGA